ncbi:Helicase [Trema orientale]|uniref:Helicase n=1 Tax=Trema orientale TaxID=63057 RepID=A0A2P5CR45_TREOI|nr:Helicase [Trema orientale]
MLTGYRTRIRPLALRGGILADDMGLGQTLTLLSLIAFDKYPSSLPFGKESIGSIRKRKIQDTVWEESSCGKQTLILCADSALSTWYTELKEHTRYGSLTVHSYHVRDRDRIWELKNYDIVLTTYAMLGFEYSIPCEHSVDEANRRWVATGIPIQNDTFDLFSYMAFLRFEPFSVESYWQTHIQIPLAHKNEMGLSQERKVYDQLEKVAKEVLQEYIRAGRPVSKADPVYTYVGLGRLPRAEIVVNVDPVHRGYIADPVYTYVGLERIPRAGIVVNVDPAHRGYMWAIECEPPSEDTRPLTGGDCNAPSPTLDVSNTLKQLGNIVEVLQDGEDLKCPKDVDLSRKAIKGSQIQDFVLRQIYEGRGKESVIEEFGAPGGKRLITILLASLNASWTGINLSAASRVYFLGPWWNLVVEEQAISRVHRIG